MTPKPPKTVPAWLFACEYGNGWEIFLDESEHGAKTWRREASRNCPVGPIIRVEVPTAPAPRPKRGGGKP